MLLLAVLHTGCETRKNMQSTAENRRTIIRNDTLFEFYTLPADHKIKVERHKFYYWFQTDTILVSQSGYSPRLLHGRYRSFYPNRNLMEEGVFRNGLKHGEWRSWQPTGHLRSVINWRNGSREGYSTEYAQDTVSSRTFYRNNQAVTDSLPAKTK